MDASFPQACKWGRWALIRVPAEQSPPLLALAVTVTSVTT